MEKGKWMETGKKKGWRVFGGRSLNIERCYKETRTTGKQLKAIITYT